MMMTALVKQGSRVAPARVPRPAPGREDVLVRVVVAGVCRTDLHVADGRIPPLHRGLILGRNRFAVLTERVLECQGFKHLTRVDPSETAALAADAFDFVIETALSTETLREMVRLARPRGTLVLKSRQPG